MKPKAVVLVGGPGTRLQPLTYEIPKSMVPILNKPLMEYTLAYLKQFGLKDIILALNYLPEVIHNHFGDGTKFGVRLTYCLEKNPMGTAGAVKNAEKNLVSTFVVLNGDIFTELDIADMLVFHRKNGAKVTIALHQVDDPSPFGVVETDSYQRVTRFIEKPPAGEANTNWINAGVYIMEPEVLEHIPANTHYMFEKGLFPLLLKLGEPVYGYPFHGYWLDLGNPEQYHTLNRDLLLSKASSPLIHVSGDRVSSDRDATIHPSADIVAPVIIGSRCQINRGVSITGPVIIGPDCHLEEDARIENTILWDNVRIGANASLSHCVISSNTTVEPDKHIVGCVVTSSQVNPMPQPSEPDRK